MSGFLRGECLGASVHIRVPSFHMYTCPTPTCIHWSPWLGLYRVSGVHSGQWPVPRCTCLWLAPLGQYPSLGTVIMVRRLKNLVGSSPVKVKYTQHTAIRCMGDLGGGWSIWILRYHMRSWTPCPLPPWFAGVLTHDSCSVSTGWGETSSRCTEADGDIGDARSGAQNVWRDSPTTLGVLCPSISLCRVSLADRVIFLRMLGHEGGGGAYTLIPSFGHLSFRVLLGNPSVQRFGPTPRTQRCHCIPPPCHADPPVVWTGDPVPCQSDVSAPL